MGKMVKSSDLESEVLPVRVWVGAPYKQFEQMAELDAQVLKTCSTEGSCRLESYFVHQSRRKPVIGSGLALEASG